MEGAEEVTFTLHGPSEVTIEADPRRMERVFLNLFTNAVAAIQGKGEVEVGVTVEGEHVRTVVRDTGRGIPRNVLTICLGKSTYARCGIIVNVTPLEPEWEGHVTLEFSNTTPLPAKIYANEGVAQMLFFESDDVCETSYKDRGGKYQGQQGVTLPKT